MSRWYIGTDTGSKALAHYAKGASAKDHKWVSRSLKNGHWVYVYKNDNKGNANRDPKQDDPDEWTDEEIDKSYEEHYGIPITDEKRKEFKDFLKGLGEYQPITGVSFATPMDYDELEREVNASLDAQDKNFATVESKNAKTQADRKDTIDPDIAKRSPSLARVKREAAERKLVAERRATQKKIQADVRNKLNATNAQSRYAKLVGNSNNQKPKASNTPKVSKEYLQELEYNSRKNVFPEGFKARPATAADADLFKNKSSAERKNKVNISDHGGNTGIKTEVTKKKKRRL